MHAFGDESGNFRNLLNGEEPHFAVAVATADPSDCRSCAGRTIRLNTDLKEARWNELPDTEKRRFLDTITDLNVTVAYATMTKADVNRLDRNYLLYNSDALTVRPSCLATGAVYTALLLSLNNTPEAFQFDRLYNTRISQEIVDILSNTDVPADAEPVISSQSKGVQVADCAAGAAREYAAVDEWESTVTMWTDESLYALATLERWLPEYEV